MKKSIIKLDNNKLIIVGGIYSNVEALKNFLNIIQKPIYKNILVINTGDIFAYFSEPDQAIDLDISYLKSVVSYSPDDS